MNSLSFTIGLNIGAERLAGAPLPRQVVCICLDCYHRVDPQNEHYPHRVPSTIAAECAWCPARDHHDMRLVALPPEMLALGGQR